MRKSELVTRMSEMTGMSEKYSEVWINVFMDAVKEELKKNGDVSIEGFGKFYARQPAAGQALFRFGKRVLPKPVFKPDSTLRKEMENKNPYFKPGKSLKDALERAERVARERLHNSGADDWF